MVDVDVHLASPHADWQGPHGAGNSWKSFPTSGSPLCTTAPKENRKSMKTLC